VIVPLLLATLSAAQLRGQTIFKTGNSAAGRAIVARVSEDTTAASLPCASCHAADGRGKSEGGVKSADIRNDTLAARYDDAKLRRVITMGIAADGRHIDDVMPRYQLQRDEANDLVAFLRKLGTLHDPGLTDSSIAIGVSTSSDNVRAAARAWADSVNARGGIYARRVELREPDENAFAMIAASSDGSFAAGHEIPLIRGSAPEDTDSRFVFTIGPSRAAEEQALRAPASSCKCASFLSSQRPSLDRDALIATPVVPDEVTGTIAVAGAHRVEQWSLLAAARVLELALTRAGRDVSRESLIAALESSYALETGYGPPVTFDASHHNGTSVVHVLRYDAATRTLTAAP
jgi:mono/diheme cytochrome c family protein